MERLTDEQSQALEQLKELTNGGNDEVTISVLESVDWDVQRAAEVVFGGGTGNNWTSAGPSSSSLESSNLPRSRPKPRMETFQVDDSTQGQVHSNNGNGNGGGMNILYGFTRPLLSLLAFPLHILSSVFRFIFGVLRIPLPNVRFTGLNFYRPLGTRPRPTNRGGPDRWVRELEEELGAICIGQLKSPRATTTAMTSGVEAGPSRLTARNAQSNGNHTEDDTKLLPDFVICKYEEFLKRCQREARIGCVILVSEEHDDTAEFKRSTLTDSNFAEALHNNNILVWGGDVRDVEAWNASEKLQATTYPFVTFISLQPRRAPSSSSSRSSNSQPTLTVLSRHQGKSYPAGTGPTSSSVLLEHLDRQLLPRINPFLERIHAQQRERERDRQLREEQDRAFEEAAIRDKARIEAKIAAEKAEIESKRKAEEEARLEAFRKEQKVQDAKRKEELRLLWRCWTRKMIVEPIVNSGGNMRIAIRLASGTRLIQSFSPNTSLTALYAFVDTQLIPSQYSTQEDSTTPPEVEEGKSSEEAIENQIVKAGGPTEWWGFQLVTAYPRSVVEWKSNVKIGDLQALRGGGQLVVETFGNVSLTSRGEGSEGDDDDEYKTESDEE